MEECVYMYLNHFVYNRKYIVTQLYAIKNTQISCISILNEQFENKEKNSIYNSVKKNKILRNEPRR